MSGRRRLVRLLRSSGVIASLLVAVVAVGVCGLRAAGVFEWAELTAYDWFLRTVSRRQSVDTRILLVTISDADIREQQQWPLADETIARAVRILTRSGASAIGLDIYRDAAVPPGTRELERVLATESRLVGVMKFGMPGVDRVEPPPTLPPENVGFNDVIVDRGGIVRRDLLFVDDGTSTYSSLAFKLAMLFLAQRGVSPKSDARGFLNLGGETLLPFEANDGPYVGADARGYQLLLDYHGGREPFPSVSLTDLLRGQVRPEIVANRVVLVGVTAHSVKDFFYTPHSRGFEADHFMPGIAIHGHAVSQLLRIALDGARPITSVGIVGKYGWIVLWCVFGGLLGLLVRSPLGLAFGAAAGLIVLGGIALGAFGQGYWLPFVPPATGWVLAAAIVVAREAHGARVQRTLIMDLFGRYVSKEVAEAAWQEREQLLEGGRLRPQRLEATILFTDLEGFTTMSEKMSPEALLGWLNEYMEAMVEQVLTCGGIINKYVGDSIMAIFGVPVARKSEAEVSADAVAAVRCALAMGDRLAQLDRRWRTEHRGAVRMRIGIFTGPVVAGNLGSRRRLEYTVVGDAVNTASRLEGFDKESFAEESDDYVFRVLVGESTARRLGRDFEIERLGDVHLKGKGDSVSVYRVRGERPGGELG